VLIVLSLNISGVFLVVYVLRDPCSMQALRQMSSQNTSKEQQLEWKLSALQQDFILLETDKKSQSHSSSEHSIHSFEIQVKEPVMLLTELLFFFQFAAGNWLHAATLAHNLSSKFTWKGYGKGFHSIINALGWFLSINSIVTAICTYRTVSI